MSVDGRDESLGDGDEEGGCPVLTQVPSQGGGADAPRGDGPAEGRVPAQREWHEDRVLSPVREPPPSDAELIVRMRSGNDTAYEELYRRHAEAVRRYARTCCRDAHTADDLTAEVFARMLQAVRGGSGPRHAVRAYLLTTVRRVATHWARSAKREQLVDDFAVFAAQSARLSDVSDDDALDLGADARAMHEAEQSLAMRAFRSLPERWQAVLWHTEVENESPSKVATLFGLDANGTRVLASRAREGLKQAYLQAHVSATLAGDEECARYADQLGTYARGRLRTRAERGLRSHLRECTKCRLAASQIVEVASNIPAVVPVAVIGWFGIAGYAKAGGVIAGKVGVQAAGAAGAAAAAGVGSSGGTAVGGAVTAIEGLGVPMKAGIAAGMVAAAVVLALAHNDNPPGRHPAAAPAASSPVVHPVRGMSAPPETATEPPVTAPESAPRPTLTPTLTCTPLPAPKRVPTPAAAARQVNEPTADGTAPGMPLGDSRPARQRHDVPAADQEQAGGVTVPGDPPVTTGSHHPCASHAEEVGEADEDGKAGAAGEAGKAGAAGKVGEIGKVGAAGKVAKSGKVGKSGKADAARKVRGIGKGKAEKADGPQRRSGSAHAAVSPRAGPG
jgi:RNA polymerase sigma factor (sigma-70 family)